MVITKLGMFGYFTMQKWLFYQKTDELHRLAFINNLKFKHTYQKIGRGIFMIDTCYSQAQSGSLAALFFHFTRSDRTSTVQ
jgi:hypothetical protein